ncbi:MAG: branched-chain amino acid transport system II carrier protein [Brevinema sp.]
MKQKNEILVSGIALFAMFFGAGNLIFPSYLGFFTGESWLIAAIGFLLVGVGIPLMGIMAFSEARSINSFADKVSKKFNIIYITVLAIVIGPLFAVPRTASTTFELAVLPFINESSMIFALITSVIFFALTYYFALKENSIVDVIGKYLTPIIVICLIVIGYLGITTHIGVPVKSQSDNNFYYGFTQGYQTMDALVSILFGIIILKDIIKKGHTEPTQQRKVLLGAGWIAAFGLSTVYFLLIFLGSRISGQSINHSTSSVITSLVEIILGKYGKFFFGVAVGAACLTTAIGVVAFVSEWFTKISNMSYKFCVTTICLFSCLMSVGGVDFLVKLSVPVLFILYPVTLVLIVLNLVKVTNHWYYKISVIATLIFSVIDVLATFFGVSFAQQILTIIPLGSKGFVWVLPFLLTLLGVFITQKCICSQKTTS